MPIQNFPIPLGFDERDPTQIGLDRASDMRNVRTTRNKVVRGPGSQTFGTGTITGTTRNFKQVFEGNARLTEYLLMFTHNRLFSYNSGTGVWGVVNGGLGEADAGSAAILTLNQIERWSIVHTLGTVFFTGPAEDEIYIFNGDTIFRFSTLGYLPSGVNSFGAHVLLPFGDRIVAVRTYEDAGSGPVDHKTRIRWHANPILGGFTDWTPDLLTGAGLLEVRESTQNPLIGAGVLGERAWLFKEREIIELIQTGSIDQVFRTEVRVSGTGMLGCHSWAAAEDFAFFVGPDNIYRWDGSRLDSIGDPVQQSFFSNVDFATTTGLMGPSKIQGIIHTPNSEYWILIQGSSAPNLWIYDYRRDRWYLDDYQGVVAIGNVRLGTLLTVPAVADSGVSERAMYGFNGELPQIVDSEILITTERDGEYFDSYITTRDFPAQAFEDNGMRMALDSMNSCWELQFRGVANAKYKVAYSTDGGTTFSTDQVVNANASGEVRAFIGPVVFSRIRFRIKSVEGQSNMEISQHLAYRWTPSGVNYGGKIL